MTSLSFKNRLNRLNQQYAEQFQVDVEEEKRRREAESVWEERKKEHLKQQEKERAQAIQDRIFGKGAGTRANGNGTGGTGGGFGGKNYVQQTEEEKISQLRQKYLGESPRTTPTPYETTTVT